MLTIRRETSNTLPTPEHPEHGDQRSTSQASRSSRNGQISQPNLVPSHSQNHQTPSGELHCKQCTDKSKNLNTLIPKSHLGNLPTLHEPNQEVQIDFAGLIPNESNNDTYTMTSVDRYSRYPTEIVLPICDTSTAIKHLQNYCEFHAYHAISAAIRPNLLKPSHLTSYAKIKT